MKIQPKTPQHLPPKPVEGPKESTGQALNKSKDTATQQGAKLRAQLQRAQHSSTTHADDNKGHDLVGSENKRLDKRFARTNNSIQSTNIMNRPSPVMSRPSPVQTPLTEAGGGGATHTVQPGDTLSGIAAQHGVNWQDLATHNGIENPNALQIGQNLEIPGANNAQQPAVSNTPAQPVTPTEPTATSSAPTGQPPLHGLDPNSIHMNQFDGDPNGSNSDCGPTSMAMALQGVGLSPEGADINSSTVDTVQAMRQSMYPDDPAQDGVTVNENGETVRNDAEHSQWTNFTGLITGAEAAGAEVNQIAPNTDDIATAVQSGHPVVVNGNPGADGGGWSDSYNSGHFITVSGYNPETETFTINDPLDNAPREVSKDDLSNYMEGWSWRALEISNPNSSAAPPTLHPGTTGPI